MSGVTAWYLLKNLFLAQRQKYPHPILDEVQDKKDERFFAASFRLTVDTSTYTKPAKYLRLRWLLPAAFALSLLLTLFLAYYSQIAIYYWHPDVKQASITPVIPALFRPEEIWQLGQQIISQVWYVGIILGIAIALLFYPQFLLSAFAIVLSMMLGMIASAHWGRVLQYFHRTAFNNTEPLFGKDISFYVFTIPIWELLELWLMALFFYSFIAVALTYLLSADSLSQGFFPGFSSKQQRHLCATGGFFMLVVAFSYWLSRYQDRKSTRLNPVT